MLEILAVFITGVMVCLLLQYVTLLVTFETEGFKTKKEVIDMLIPFGWIKVLYKKYQKLD